MIDSTLVALVQKTSLQLGKMKDARPSEILAVKEQFAKECLALLAQTTADITPQQKIAAFDQLAAAQIKELTTQIENAVNGRGYWLDEEAKDYDWEQIRNLVFGGKIFIATSRFERLLSGLERDQD